MNRLFILLTGFLVGAAFTSEAQSTQHPEQPYYITPRTGTQHIDLTRDWQLNHLDAPLNALGQLPVQD